MAAIYFLHDIHFILAVILRAVVGVGHGPLYPATYTFWSMWAVPLERSTLTSIGFCSNNLGTGKISILFFLSIINDDFFSKAITMLIGGLLCRYVSSGWVYIFVLTGIFGFIWLPLWLWLAADSPQSHQIISERERNYICEHIGISTDQKKKKSASFTSLPWKKIVHSKPIIALFITQFCTLFVLFFFYTNVGKLLTEIHRIPTQYAGYVLAGGFIITPIVSLSSGKITKQEDIILVLYLI
jgi:sugar phosphate permease